MLRDLTCHDDGEAPHVVELVVDTIEKALAKAWPTAAIHRDPGPRVVTVADNYDRLRYSTDAVTREARYSRYLGDGRMLRSHTTARIPALLDRLAASGEPERLLSVPGICYRRDVIDRRHVGEPHQHDLWLVRRAGPRLTEDDLEAMVAAIVTARAPGPAVADRAQRPPLHAGGAREIYVDSTRSASAGWRIPRCWPGRAAADRERAGHGAGPGPAGDAGEGHRRHPPAPLHRPAGDGATGRPETVPAGLAPAARPPGPVGRGGGRPGRGAAWRPGAHRAG